tara:strand:+ start:511 stop:717 length:207 start_codon:yes stop_codon:yes gene_type:complete
MNLILRPLDNVGDPVWSVIWMIVILLVGVSYFIVYILGMDGGELNGSNDAAESEELLQLPSSGDKPCS